MFGVFDPQGPIASQERNVIVTAVLVMLLVAIPLLVALYTIAWKYRAGNKKAQHDPERVGNVQKQLVWWGIPAAIIVVISILNWQSTHALDPSKRLVSDVKPLTIQVVALDWKWLFIYPDQNIATVNYIQFPVGMPVHFQLTADAPMNSFWIPQLGGQIYAMSGMTTQLNLEADKPGMFAGKAAEINGEGYAGMNFVAEATSENDFNTWVAAVKNESSTLDESTYTSLSLPSQNNMPALYSSVDKGLYESIVAKYMTPNMPAMNNMNQ